MKADIEDLRVLKSKKRLYSAFEKALASSSTEELSINSICDSADVNRSTFYKHFENKQDFVNSYMANTIEVIFEAVTDGAAASSVTEKNISQVSKEILRCHDTVLNIITTAESPTAFVYLNDIAARCFTGIITRRHLVSKQLSDLSAQVCCYFYAGGISAVICKWILAKRSVRMDIDSFSGVLIKMFKGLISDLNEGKIV